MKNWGKCLHESQTNIWDVCVCVCVHMWMMGGRGAKGNKVLPCLTQVQWSGASLFFHAPGQQKSHKSLSIDEITKKAFRPIRPHL